MGGSDKPKMVLLTATNYHIWKTKMLDRLYVKQLASPIEEEGIRPPGAVVQEWSELDRRCLGFIRDYIDVGVIHHVENATTVYSCWKKLQGLYERKTASHKVALVRQLGKLRYIDGSDICYASSNEDWVVHSGASFHVTPHKRYFHTYEQGDFGEAKMGNNGISKIVVVGEVYLKSREGNVIVLSNVRHIPDFRLSLIYSEKLDDDGYVNLFGNGQWVLRKDNNVIAKGKKNGTFYRASFNICKGELNIVQSSLKLWHSKLGHMSIKGLNILVKQGAIPDLDDSDIDTCTHCIIGKQHRVTFNKSNTRKTKIMQMMYSDVCGPIKVKTLGACSYFVTFIDDYSRKTWAYAIKSKDLVCEYFKTFHMMIERQTEKTLKCIRTDNRGEYIGLFDKYCKEKGMRHEQSVP
ncbi:hypothetical protein LIER_28792 [Lithospermum erythrorhizon]|uniref:Integrase catalytic domain-containing protein n=1 Tax=Lithospermum erythrorhizon TaxID=34254 RepID=A0AAV3RMW6_LITER